MAPLNYNGVCDGGCRAGLAGGIHRGNLFRVYSESWMVTDLSPLIGLCLEQSHLPWSPEEATHPPYHPTVCSVETQP